MQDFYGGRAGTEPAQPRLNLDQLEYFVQVAQVGSFSRAAHLVGLSQPSLSRQMRLLEQALGERLMHRTGRGVTLTDAGSCMVAHAEKILAEVRAARQHLQELRTTPSGHVVVGITASLATHLTPRLVKQFRCRFPAATIGVVDGLSAELREALLAGRVDVAALYSADQPGQLGWETVMREELVLVCGNHMRGALPTSVTFDELARYPLVLPSLPNPIRTLLEAQCRRRNVSLSLVAEVNAIESLVATAASSDYFSVLPEGRALEAAAQGQLAVAHIHSPRVLNRLSLATSSNAPDAPLVRGVKLILRELLQVQVRTYTT